MGTDLCNYVYFIQTYKRLPGIEIIQPEDEYLGMLLSFPSSQRSAPTLRTWRCWEVIPGYKQNQRQNHAE